MANNYLDDLVQNIYTNCDMSGFEDYKRGVQSLKQNMASFNADTIRSQKAKISLMEAETKSQIRLADYQEKYALKKKRRDEEEIRRMHRKNGLQRYFTRLLVGALSFQAIKGVIDTASRIQLLQKSIEGLTKSTQDWDYIKTQAFEKGIDLEVVAKGYRNFFSSAKMAGFDKQGIQNMYADVLLSTRAIGATPQQTEGALLALEQMISKGTVSMEELRRQLGNALPGAFEIGAKAMNMTTKEFNAFVKTGKLASNEFVPRFIAQLKQEYASGFKDISETVSYASVRMSNAWKMFQYEIMNGQAGKELAKGLEEVTKFLRSPEAKGLAQNLGRLTTIVIKLLTFLINHGKLILFLFGTSGIIGLLTKYPQIIQFISLGLKDMIGYAILCGQANVTAWTSANAAALGFLATLLKIIAPLMFIEDTLLGLGQHFFGWKVRSNFGDMLDYARGNKHFGMSGLKDDKIKPFKSYSGLEFDSLKSLGGIPIPNYLRTKEFSNLIQNDPYKAMDILRKSQANMSTMADRPTNMSTFADRPTELQLDKSQHISMGDIKIEIQGSSNPQETALAVQDTLVSLLMGQNGVTV